MCSDGPVYLDLTERQRVFLGRALGHWRGPSRASDDLARTLGYAEKDALQRDLARLTSEVEAEAPLDRRDWMTAMTLAELTIGNSEIGAARGQGLRAHNSRAGPST